MDVKSGYAIILIAMALAAQIACKACGIDGNVDASVQGILALSAMMLGAKGIFDAKKEEKDAVQPKERIPE